MAYVSGFFFLAIMGFGFWNGLAQLAHGATINQFADGLFGSAWYWLAMLLMSALTTMRLFAEENRLGTLETLLAAPVTETAVVLAKYASAFTLFLLLWLLPLAYAPILRYCGAQTTPIAWSGVATGYLGTALVGSLFLAIGLFCSLLSRHQMVAASSCLGALGILLLMGHHLLSEFHGAGHWIAQMAAPTRHLPDFTAGIVDSRRVVWYISTTALILFMSIRVLEARRLR